MGAKPHRLIPVLPPNSPRRWYTLAPVGIPLTDAKEWSWENSLNSAKKSATFGTRNAAFWDERMGEGNDWHRLLIAPAQERLLALQRDELVLDVACGNGQFARHMARLGALGSSPPTLLRR